MSKILRRPMFRGGGKVSSYGKGITTGLTNGYAGGGQIGGGYIHGAAFPDGRYGFADPSTYSQGWNRIWGNTKNTGANVVQAAKDKVAQGAGKTTNFLNKSKSFLKSKNFSEAGLKKAVKKYGPKVLKYGKNLGLGAFKRFPVASTYGLPVGLLGVKSQLIKPTDADKEYGVKDWEKAVASSLPGGGNENLPLILRKLLGVEKKVDQEPPTGIIGPPGGGDPDMYAEKPVPPPALTMKQQVEKDKALFADLLGEGEARGKDVSDMLLRFAGSGGNTVGEKFQQYIGAEAQAGPSRTEKINQAAASLAINDYISGKRSKENMEMMLKKTEHQVDYSMDAQKAAKDISNMNFSDGLDRMVELMGGKKNRMDPVVIKSVLTIQMPGQQINIQNFNDKSKNEVGSLDAKEFDIGINIVTYDGGKMLVERVGDIVTEVPDLFIT